MKGLYKKNKKFGPGGPACDRCSACRHGLVPAKGRRYANRIFRHTAKFEIASDMEVI